MSEYTAGFRYLFGIHMGVCRGPVDEVCEYRVGDRTAWTGSMTANGQHQVDAYDLFGGEDGEGGVQGSMDVLMGGDTQVAPDGLINLSINSSANGDTSGNLVLGSAFMPSPSTINVETGYYEPDTIYYTKAGFEFRTDGTAHSYINEGAFSRIAKSWHKQAPLSTAVTENFEIKIEQAYIQGDIVLTGDVGSWLFMDVARSFMVKSLFPAQGTLYYLQVRVIFRLNGVESSPFLITIVTGAVQVNQPGDGA